MNFEDVDEVQKAIDEFNEVIDGDILDNGDYYCSDNNRGMTAKSLSIIKQVLVQEVVNKKCLFSIGDKVSKVGGDYTFEGIVVAAFAKLSGVTRYVVEDDRGVLHVYSDKVLKFTEESAA